MANPELLKSVADSWTEELKSRPGVVGVFLYGSLARGADALHEFSDVDVALVLEDNDIPAQYAEHRLLDRVKTDTTLLPASTLDGWQQTPPTRLYEGHWTNSLFLSALTQNNDSILLYDPQDRVRGARAALPDYKTLVLPEVRRWITRFRTECLEKAAAEPEKLYELLHPWWLRSIATHWADKKSFPIAAAQLELPEIIEDMVRWEALLEYPTEHLEQVCDAYVRLGELAQTDFYSQLDIPSDLEIVGDWNVFWPGNRIHTMERVLAELPQTLRWSEFLRQQGKLAEARYILWPCDPAGIRQRVAALRDALKSLGYDIEGLAEPFLSGSELSNSETALADCLASGAQRQLSEADSVEVFGLATKVLERLETRAHSEM
ncbi:MAG: nucleotidyltransferase domain-containing protein [Armatimonas sp.]